MNLLNACQEFNMFAMMIIKEILALITVLVKQLLRSADNIDQK
jgi:hypothetical protein